MDIHCLDNVSSDNQTFLRCIPSLAENIAPVDPDDLSDLPLLRLPSEVEWHICSTDTEIANGCQAILALIADDSTVIHIGFDTEWDFSTDTGSSGSQKTAMVQIALESTVYLLRVAFLKKLPSPMVTLLESSQIVKVGKNIGQDLSKLNRDFPGDFKLPPKIQKHYKGTIELGSLAKQKRVVPQANASLSTIAAATLKGHLSKDLRASEWSAKNLDESHYKYAALDAYISLKIWGVLREMPEDGLPLTSTTKVGQAVSLWIRKKEVAHGIIVEQPEKFRLLQKSGDELRDVEMNISSTHTKAVVQINQVLAPGAIIPHHRRKLADIQDGNSSFGAVVSISSLKTYVKPSTVQDQPVENVPKEFSECVLIKPPSDIPEIAVTAGESQTIGELLGIDSLSKLEGEEEEEEEEEFLYADDFEPEIPSNDVKDLHESRSKAGTCRYTCGKTGRFFDR
ncbi:ribonuclease H-like protein [Dendrothele bispora CBS 962.96]|uniref:Ribonuclease H-like protein n=1 Tax=Dendrothele bispora (strain CBS 962.96) TaxID=1314807 RepID=A0A4S8L061_DENBC|nr:ribonuclease H-like protein [Dendrothele bispora CBS 962.96]